MSIWNSFFPIVSEFPVVVSFQYKYELNDASRWKFYCNQLIIISWHSESHELINSTAFIVLITYISCNNMNYHSLDKLKYIVPPYNCFMETSPIFLAFYIDRNDYYFDSRTQPQN